MRRKRVLGEGKIGQLEGHGASNSLIRGNADRRKPVRPRPLVPEMLAQTANFNPRNDSGTIFCAEAQPIGISATRKGEANGQVLRKSECWC